jgi:hypothetical protein
MLHLLLVGRKKKKGREKKKEKEMARGLFPQGKTHLAICATCHFRWGLFCSLCHLGFLDLQMLGAMKH